MDFVKKKLIDKLLSLCLCLSIVLLIIVVGLRVEFNKAQFENLKSYEIKELYRIDLETAKHLSTKKLLNRILEDPYIGDIFAFDTLDMGIEFKNYYWQVDELFSRDDIKEVLEDKLVKLDKYSSDKLELAYESAVDKENFFSNMSEKELDKYTMYRVCEAFLWYVENFK